LIIFTCQIAFSQNYPIVETNITDFYSNTAIISPPFSGDDYYYPPVQKAVNEFIENNNLTLEEKRQNNIQAQKDYQKELKTHLEELESLDCMMGIQNCEIEIQLCLSAIQKLEKNPNKSQYELLR
jgi:hypothetical protein